MDFITEIRKRVMADEIDHSHFLISECRYSFLNYALQQFSVFICLKADEEQLPFIGNRGWLGIRVFFYLAFHSVCALVVLLHLNVVVGYGEEGVREK